MPSTYRPLNHGNQFRLLRLLPNNGDATLIRCELIVQPIPDLAYRSNSIKYEALSYVWGTELCKRPILVDGWEREIGQNLWNFLNQMQNITSTQPRLLWIDALCIDQANLAERSTQVQVMGSIYRAASRTIVWLGRGNVDAGLATAYMDQMPPSGPTSHPSVHLLSDGTFYKAIDTWLRLPYWSRTWIVQEFLISPQVTFMYGDHTVSVANVLLSIKNLLNIFKASSSSKALEKLSQSPGVELLQQRLNLQQRMTLASLIIRNQKSRCLEPRDKVYAILSLAEDQVTTARPIKVDYSCEIQAVFQDVLNHWNQNAETKADLYRLGAILAKVLKLQSTALLRRSTTLDSFGKLMPLPLTVSSSRSFDVRAYNVGSISQHTKFTYEQHKTYIDLRSEQLLQAIKSNNRFSSWIRRCSLTDELETLCDQLTAPPYCASWLQRFHSVHQDAKLTEKGSDISNTFSLVGVSFSKLKSHNHSIGIAIGDVKSGDFVLQALSNELLFAYSPSEQAESVIDTASPTGMLICTRSGETGLDRLTNRQLEFAAVTSEMEITQPLLSTVLSFSLQEFQVLCGGC